MVLVANKCEGGAGETGFYDAYALGLGEPVAISAEHAEGMADLYDRIDEAAASVSATEPGAEAVSPSEAGPLKLAIVGRPNVGKSTLVNRLTGTDRLLTGPEPGITRDAIAVRLEVDGREIELVDTAGLRRRARVTDRLERLSANDTLNAVRMAEVVAVVVDGAVGMEKQDLGIASMAVEEGRALLIVVNKWDLVGDGRRAMARLRERLGDSLPAGPGRGDRSRIRAHGRAPGNPAAHCVLRPRGVEPAGDDRTAQPMAERDRGPPPATDRPRDADRASVTSPR